MAVDIKKMVDVICSLTVLELSKLVKALRDKFGLRTSDTIRTDINEVVEAEAVAEKSTKSEKESKPAPDPSSVEVPNARDESEDEPPPAVEEKVESGYDPHIPTPEELGEDGELEFDYDFEDDEFDEDDELEDDLHVIYAWRWSGDNKRAKIGISTESRLDDRINKGKTYHPTDEPIRIGVCIEKYDTRKQALAAEKSILEEIELTLTHPRREWVKIDEKFKKMIDKYFE